MARDGSAGRPDGSIGPPQRSDLLLLGMLAPLAGLGVGVLGAFFRLALDQANRAREALIARADAWGIGGFVLVVAMAAAATALAAWLVRRVAPSASGSGIPRVMAVLEGDMAPAPLRVIPVKFLAGTLGMGAGLALGREGPTVQMGASLAYQVGRLMRQNGADCRWQPAPVPALPSRSMRPSPGLCSCSKAC